TKIINFWELENVNVKRELNGEVSDYNLIQNNKNKITFSKYDPNEKLKYTQGKSLSDITKEKEAFENSEYKELALNVLKQDKLIEYKSAYARKKLGQNASQKNIEYISKLIDSFDQHENSND